MSQNSRLSMLDEFGGRRQIIPAEVRGRLRSLRNHVYMLLLVIFLALPWLRINGTQAILLDIPGRHFEFFGMVFLSHDSPLLFFVMVIFVLSIVLMTAIWGRVWCGWACPQTVFIDFVYRKIEIMVEGNYLERRKLRDSPMNLRKFLKTSLKWFLYLVVSSLFAHSFIAYFSGGEHLLEMMRGTPQENWNYFLTVSVVTAVVMFNFGWFREQFCIIMCPYGRFQSVLMDDQSVTVTYNSERGEPRKGIHPAKVGDCVSCNRCVQVCPTGIDIRNGIQMECIGCTACIDACDEIMSKLRRPQGLISYRAASAKINYFRPRVMAYLVLIAVFSLGLTYSVANHEPFSVVTLRATDIPYQVSPEGLIINHYKVHLHNQSRKSQVFIVSLDRFNLVQSADRYEVKAGDSREVHLFVNFPREALDMNGKVLFALQVHELASQKNQNVKMTGIGPSRH